MTRLTLTKEALLNLHNARKSVEKDIKEAKAVLRRPHTLESGASTFQSRLVAFKREATLIYTALALQLGKTHCAKGTEALAALQERAARGRSVGEIERLVLTALPLVDKIQPNASAAA